MKKPIICILAISLLISFQAKATDTLYDSHRSFIKLKEAIDAKMLNIWIRGTYDPLRYYEVADRDGVHYGKCMEAMLESNLDSNVILELEPGTLLIPADDDFQKMLVTKRVLLPLYAREKYRTRLYAMCSQMHKEAPYNEANYTVGTYADTSLVRLARHIDRTYSQNMIAQHAVWAYTDSATYSELEIYGADSNTILRSIAMLNEVKINTKLNPPSPFPVNDTATDNKISLDRYLVYGGCGAITILLLTSVTLAVKRKRKSDQQA